MLHPDNPISIAPQANEDWVMEIRKQTDEAAKRVKDVIWEAHNDFKELFGRGGDNPFFEEYMTEDAEYVLFGMGSLGLPAKVMVRRLREQGEKVGFVRLKWFRPSPTRSWRRSWAASRPSASSTAPTRTARRSRAGSCSPTCARPSTTPRGGPAWSTSSGAWAAAS